MKHITATKIKTRSQDLLHKKYSCHLSTMSIGFPSYMRTVLLFIGICISLLVNAQVVKLVEVTPGSLSTSLTATELSTITNLTLTGTMDARDFKTMRDLMLVLAEINISNVTITAYSGNEGTILYPGNFPANTLPAYAFNDNNQWTGKTTLTSILLPESITALGVSCFAHCSGLNAVVIPSSVISIGDKTFDGCNVLTTISIPPSVTSIGVYAFRNCSKLNSVVIPSSVTSIKEGTFSYCSSLTTISIPSSVTSIGKVAFRNCSHLTSVEIPSSVTSIGEGAFVHCGYLTTLSIPSSVISIGDVAFAGCWCLKAVTIPASVILIGFRAFESCWALIEVDENNQTYSSLDGVLYNKAQTTLIQCPVSKEGSVNIPSTVTAIGMNAFKSCLQLTTVTIPSSITSIGEEAFYGCSVTSIVIPPSVSTIAASTFMNCTSLISITIPASIVSIGEYAFAFCSRLTSIIAANPIPVNLTSSSQVFEQINPSTCTLYVPVGSKSAYQAATGWKNFTHIVEDPNIPTGLEPILNEKLFPAYPNPTLGITNLVLDQIPAKETYLTVTDVRGKTILKQLLKNKEEWIDLGGNPPGIYLLKTNLHGMEVQKILLK